MEMTVLNYRSSSLGAIWGGQWLRSCVSLVLAGALLGATACKDDEKPPTDQLSAVADKGLSITPVEIDVNGLTIAEKERIGVGSYLVNAVGDCNSCHQTLDPNGPSKYLSGGIAFPISAAGDLVYTRNLTPDPDTGMKLTEDEFVQSMRTGKDFKSDNAAEQLIVMPWATFRWMSTEDLKSIYAYLKKLPAIRNPVPNDLKGAAAALQPVPFPSAYSDGEVSRPLPPESTSDKLGIERGLALQTLADPAALTSLSADDRTLYARGSYLVNAVADCSGCHTNPSRDFINQKVPADKFLSGGAVFAPPPGLDALLKTTRSMSANLLGGSHGVLLPMTYEQFKKVIVDGKFTQGTVTRDVAYPMAQTSEALRKMNEDDIQAIYTYLKNQTARTGAGDKLTQPPARWCAQDTDCNAGGGETCNTATKECVGSTCTQEAECGACQTCASGHCAAPSQSSTCPVFGI
jgi:mono/diheme cytochrome c family protein